MDREKVYNLIEGERNYQGKRWDHTKEQDIATPIANWILYMRFQLSEAEKAVYFLDSTKALENIRKSTALGVACMEYNETPPRQ